MENSAQEKQDDGLSNEMMLKASMIEKHLQELMQKAEYVSQQLSELEEFSKELNFLKDPENKETFASIGRGVYLKSKSNDNNFFVNVGSGVLVKKTLSETAEIIEAQIKGFHEARHSLMLQIEAYQNLLNETIAGLDKSVKK